MTKAERIAMYRAAAESGEPMAVFARRIGKTVQAVWAYAKANGIAFATLPASALMNAMNADPKYNPLVVLTPEQRADYDILTRKGRLSRADALKQVLK